MFRYKAFWFDSLKEAREFSKFIRSKIKPNIDKIEGIELSLVNEKQEIHHQYNVVFAEIYSALDSFDEASDNIAVIVDRKENRISQVWFNGYVNKLKERRMN